MKKGGAVADAIVAELAARLGHENGSVRRVAAIDLIGIGAEGGERAEEANRALLEHLAREREAKIAVRIARHFGDARWGPAKETLWRLYEERSTPVEIAHAAVLAHDRIEGAGAR